MAADEKLLPNVFFVWSLQGDPPAAPSAATVAEAEPPAAPQVCGTPWGVWGSAASSGALGATRSVLLPEVVRRCVRPFGQSPARCRVDRRQHPSNVHHLAGELPARTCLLPPAGTVAFLARPHVVVPMVSAEKEPGAHQVQAGFAGCIFLATSITLAGC